MDRQMIPMELGHKNLDHWLAYLQFIIDETYNNL